MGKLRFNRRKKVINTGLIKNIVIWILEIVFVVFMAGLLTYFAGARVTVIGQSMSPTLKNGSEVLMNRFVYMISAPKRNDIIIFKPNGNEKSHYYIKRVIGLPGETIQIKSGVVYINGEKLDDKIATEMSSAGIADTEIVVGEDDYFVLGDNRNSSEDSRYSNIGNIAKKDIAGKAWMILSPKSQFGFIK